MHLTLLPLAIEFKEYDNLGRQDKVKAIQQHLNKTYV